MLARERHQREPCRREAIGRMLRIGPLDQRRHQPALRQAPVVRNGDPPCEIAARHRQDRPEVGSRRVGVDVARAHDPVHERRTLGEPCPHPWVVEIEPARPGRCAPRGIDRHHLDVQARTQADQRVVRSHRDVCAARLRIDADPPAQPRGALGERARRDDQVIDGEVGSMPVDARHRLPWSARRGPAHRRGKSSSTRAPLRSWKNNCHISPPGRRRQSVRDAAVGESLDGVGEPRGRERHVVDDAAPQLGCRAIADDVQDRRVRPRTSTRRET